MVHSHGAFTNMIRRHIHVTAWHAIDVPTSREDSSVDECEVIAFGKYDDDDDCGSGGDNDRDGSGVGRSRSVALRIAFTPFFYAAIPASWSDARATALMHDLGKFGLVTDRTHTGIVWKTSIWGYCDRPSRFLQLAFASQGGMKRAAYAVRRVGLKTFESNVDPIVKLLHSRSLPGVGWIEVASDVVIVIDDDDDERISTCDLEMRAAAPTAVGPWTSPPPGTRPPVTIASWDLECFSASRRFPNAKTDTDCIINIATAFSTLGFPDEIRRVVLCLGETLIDDADADIEIRSFASEASMIEAWVDLLHEARVDLLIGYNVDGFDWKYVFDRVDVVLRDGCGDALVDLSGLGRLKIGGGVRQDRKLDSKAYGNNEFVVAATPGIAQMDLLSYIRRERKLESYSLDNVSATYLDGDRKIDLPAHRIFDLFEHGGSAGRAEIARYASKDTVLPIRLLERMRIFTDVAELSNACSLPIDAILNRGQQIRVFSCVLNTARAMQVVVPDDEAMIAPEGKTYEGATVLDPVCGAHTQPVCTLDFASRECLPARCTCAPTR